MHTYSARPAMDYISTNLVLIDSLPVFLLECRHSHLQIDVTDQLSTLVIMSGTTLFSGFGMGCFSWRIKI